MVQVNTSNEEGQKYVYNQLVNILCSCKLFISLKKPSMNKFDIIVYYKYMYNN